MKMLCVLFLSLIVLFTITNGKKLPSFEVDYEWIFINFTWVNGKTYKEAIDTKKYIPENNAMAGIKLYKNKIYIAIPRIRPGTPVTLGYISRDADTPKRNPLISPFPNWETHNLDNKCDELISVQSMEIDRDGILWTLDGHRTKPGPCPPKLVLYDLKTGNKIVKNFDFPNYISLTVGGFLNDIVVDHQDGGFAYITDHSTIDPGLVVYSREKNWAWKLRDSSMFAEPRAAPFTVAEMKVDKLAPIDGIALSPPNSSGARFVYYCALTGFGLYSISTDILKSETESLKGQWRFNVSYIGAKRAQSDGMVVDDKGNLYYGLLPLYGVGKCNVNEDFENAEVVDKNNETMIWTDSFGFDDQGYLFLLTNHIGKYFGGEELELSNEVIFRILKLFTGTKSYLHYV